MERTTDRSHRVVLGLDTVWIAIAIAVPVIGALAVSMSTVDLAYHVRAGNDVLRNGIIRTDTYSFAGTRLPWLDQQWASQVLFALAYRLGGWNALMLLNAALSGLGVAFLYLACVASGTRTRTAAILSVAGYVVASNNLAMRPQLVAVPLFTATLWLLAGRERYPGRIWWIPVIAVVWANAHGSFALAPLLVGLAWLDDRRLRSPRARRTLLVAAVSLLATLLNPFGFAAWTYIVTISSNPTIRRWVSEWQPTSIRTVSGALFFPSVAAVAWYLARRGRPTPWTSLLRLAIFFALGLQAIRGVVWWGCAAPVIIAELLSESPAAEREPRAGSPVLNLAVVAVLALAIVAMLPFWRGTDPASGAPKILIEAPQTLAEAVQSAAPAGARLWVSQVWGSYFEFEVPKDRVFVDSRIEIYPDAVWNDYMSASNAGPGWQAILSRWQVDAVVLSREQSGALLDAMRGDPAWHLVLETDQGAVFVPA
jgi:hypothetical protein